MENTATKNNIQVIAKTANFETIKVEGSDSSIYTKLMEHTATNSKEETFKNDLEEAISASVQDFKVFVCEPSIDEDGNIQFIPSIQHRARYSYNKLSYFASKNGLRLGSKFEYVLFF